MPDRYIDYDEVSEYGENFVEKVPLLAGQSVLVDVATLATLVSNAINAVETELQKATGDRSELRGERLGTAEATERVRDTISRFYHHLRSLPKTTHFDFDALFSGRTMGDLASLKPADVEAKAAEVLRGFDTPKNTGVAAFDPWKAEIHTAHQTLSNALSGKGIASGQAFVATAALVEARKNFLHVYNKVAKPIVRGLLALLGRENEWALFFKDVAVNEGGHANSSAATPTAPTTTP